MIAQRLSGDIDWVVVGSPAYLACGAPAHPRDLLDHRCLRIKLGDHSIYHWEFEKDGEQLAIDVPGAITIDHTRLALDLVTTGTALAYLPESCVTALVASGALRIVLADWTVTGPGFHTYCSGRRRVPTGLRLLIDLIREPHPLAFQVVTKSDAHHRMERAVGTATEYGDVTDPDADAVPRRAAARDRNASKGPKS